MKACVIRTPASSANLGPGFDSLGVALDLYNTVEVELRPEGLSFGECDDAFRGENNLFVRAYNLALDRMGLPRTGLWVSEHPAIPQTRGLGSSAATIVAGVMAANFLHSSPLTKEELLGIAIELEHHPDNLAPALLGGLRASMMVEGRPVSVPLNCANLLFTALIPPFPLSTSKARDVLPDMVPLRDAVFNLSRVALLIRGFEKGDLALMRAAMQDRLHQNFRRTLIPGYDEMEALAGDLGAAVCLSGAGPTIMCISQDPGFPKKLKSRLTGELATWQVVGLHRDTHGAVAEER